MVLIKEFRIVMPLTVDEYKIGQLYTVAHLSKNETGGGDGVEVLKNEPFTGVPLFDNQYSEGQYTKKLYIGKKKVNGIVRTLLPQSALMGIEEAWNAYPYCRTIIKNEYMGEDFEIRVESLHLPGRGDQDNVHNLSQEKLAAREVILIDIAEEVASSDYKQSDDPTKFKSTTTGRGPLRQGWIRNMEPVMTCYKLVTVKFKWFGLQSMVESRIIKAEKRIFTLFHRQVFCLIDEWHGKTIEEIRQIEQQTQAELRSEIKKGDVKGIRQNE